MITARFRSLGWVAGVAVSALACYLVTQRVASERIQLSRIGKQIVAGERNVHRLATEIETRGRLPQLERWNEEVLALTAPQARQYVASAAQLASLEAVPRRPALPLDSAATPPRSVRQASYSALSAAQPAPSPAGDDTGQPALRHTTYDKPHVDKVVDKPTKLALESGDFKADLDRLAALEAKRARR